LIFAKVVENNEIAPNLADLLGSLHWFMAGMLQNRLDRTSTLLVGIEGAGQ
jgi:hypothetical protein